MAAVTNSTQPTEAEHMRALTEKYAHHAPDFWVPELGIFRVKRVGDVNIDVLPLIFTAAIVTTPVTSDITYTDRWCYRSIPEALAEAQRWPAVPGSEPQGWHRHPGTGRRRENGVETIMP